VRSSALIPSKRGKTSGDTRCSRSRAWWSARTPGLWPSLADPNSRATGDNAIAVDVSPDRRRSVIAAAGELDDGRILVEILSERAGVSWVVDEVAALEAAHHPGAVVVDGAGQAESLIAPLEKAGVRVTRTGPREMAAACGGLHDAVLEGRLVHMGEAALDGAVEGASQRTLGDAWTCSRRSSPSNVSLLVAASLAHWAVAGGHLRRPFEILANPPSRRYGYRHQRIRAAFLPEAYGRACLHCGLPMMPGQALGLDHTADGSQYRGMAHSRCNRREGPRRGNAARRPRRRVGGVFWTS
jgi:hypothetical protein